jgi:GWxTD domain-containing protein
MSKLWRLLLAGLVCTALSGGVRADDNPDRLTVYAGVFQFANPIHDSTVLAEFALSLNRHEFDFARIDTDTAAVEARVVAQVMVWGADGTPVDSAVTSFSLRAENAAAAQQEGLQIFNKLSLHLKPGMYSARITVIDALSRRQGEYFIDYVEAAPTLADVLTVTKAQMAHRIRYVGEEREGVQDHMVRNGYEIIPSPKSFFGSADSLACFYAEIYNLDDSVAVDSFLLVVDVLDGNQAPYRSIGQRRAAKPGPSAVVAESIDIKAWPTGLYYLRLTVTDGERTAESMTPFRIISPQEVMDAYARSVVFDPYDTLSLETRLMLIKYLTTPTESTTLEGLTDQGKETFLGQFWRQHDNDPATAANEYRLEMIERLDYVLVHFSTNAELTNGWHTDRGRILLTRGFFDDLDDHDAPMEEVPYQVWNYQSNRQSRFYIFQDHFGDNDFRLVHSNDPAEIYSSFWQERINSGEVDMVQ